MLACALAVLVAGCGSGGESATDAEKAADAEMLNELIGQEQATIDAYGQGLALLHGRVLALAGQLRGQDQAHVDALTKVMRGLGGEVDPEAVEPASPEPRSRAEALAFDYEGENASLSEALGAVPAMQTAAPRALAAALAASHAQHLVVLRQALGTGLAGAVPGAFEPGDLPPPGSSADGPETSK